VAGALVEQPDNLRVQLVNRLTMFGNVQAKVECRIQKEESNLFRNRRNLPRRLNFYFLFSALPLLRQSSERF
jgi:hypothetical protein